MVRHAPLQKIPPPLTFPHSNHGMVKGSHFGDIPANTARISVFHLLRDDNEDNVVLFLSGSHYLLRL